MQESYMGYIKLHRKLLKNPICSRSEYFHLWVVMLLKANHSTGYKLYKNEKLILQPGQFTTGRKALSAETGISESQVYKILKYLEKEQQISLKSNNKFTLITILNWVPYQGNGTTDFDEMEQPSNSQVTAKEQPSNTNNNVKNVKNVNNNIINTNTGINKGAKPKENYNEIYNKVQFTFNELCQSFKPVEHLSAKRKKAIYIIWKKYKDMEVFEELFSRAESSEFLTGRDGQWHHCSFDWILKFDNFVKIMEGNYDNRQASKR